MNEKETSEQCNKRRNSFAALLEKLAEVPDSPPGREGVILFGYKQPPLFPEQRNPSSSASFCHVFQGFPKRYQLKN